jgi:hypothetical protein
LRVKAHLAATTVVVVNPIQHAPALTVWLAVVVEANAVTVVVVAAVVAVAAMVVAVAAAVALAAAVVDMVAAVAAVAVRSAADHLFFEPASALVR